MRQAMRTKIRLSTASGGEEASVYRCLTGWFHYWHIEASWLDRNQLPVLLAVLQLLLLELLALNLVSQDTQFGIAGPLAQR